MGLLLEEGYQSLQQRKRKITVATLAESLEQITQALPALSNQLHGTRSGISIEKATCTSASPAAPRVPFGPAETAESAEDLRGDQSDLAKAVLAQSQALTALVTQIACNSGDPLQDMASSLASISSRGPMGRAKLQGELAPQKGVFFQNVLQNMSRRMFPSQQAEVEMSVLQQRGVTPTQYLERFGGFGRTFLQEDNLPAAKDALSLLLVCLEQAAMDEARWMWVSSCGFGGGPTTDPVLGSVSCSWGQPQTLRSNGQPTMGTG